MALNPAGKGVEKLSNIGIEDRMQGKLLTRGVQ
jgi:hypothetical protein